MAETIDERDHNVVEVWRKDAKYQVVDWKMLESDVKSALLAVAREQREPACEWVEDSDGILQTACNNAFQLEAGNLEENGFKFCCYCGHTIAAAIRASTIEGE
jgi:hypothetical protein